MANHKSSKKRARQNLKIKARNLSINKTIRTFEKKLTSSIEAKDLKLAEELFKTYSAHVQKGAQKANLHINKAARKVSQYSKKVFSLSK